MVLHSERCIGCRYCEMACPFGAPAFDAEEGVMTKCHLCHHRLDEGLLPACVSACPTEALRYGLSQRRRRRPRAWSRNRCLGFVAPGKVRPSLRLGLPGGEIRSRRYGSLVEALVGAGVMKESGRKGGSHDQ